MINLDNLFRLLDKDPYLERLHHLEAAMDSNKEIVNLINKKKEISKNMINSKVIGLTNNYESLKNEYNTINEQIKDVPFLDEYLDLLEYYNDYLKTIISYLEDGINKEL